MRFRLGPLVILAGYLCFYMAAGWKLTIAMVIIHAGDYMMYYAGTIDR